jgi:hypothetical protein
MRRGYVTRWSHAANAEVDLDPYEYMDDPYEKDEVDDEE